MEAGRLPGAGRVLRADPRRVHRHPRQGWRVRGRGPQDPTEVGGRPASPGRAGTPASDRHPPRALAAWVTHPKNPYFARAAVNRVWAVMFGRPLVSPIDNLEPDGPVPLALQVLAEDFATHRFELRRLIRLIASTEAFRLDSATEY